MGSALDLFENGKKPSLAGAMSANKADVKGFQKSEDQCMLDISSKNPPSQESRQGSAFKARPFTLTQGDRFVPLRGVEETEDLPEASERYERKIEIESRPPENLHEDGRLDATPQQNNNQQNNNQQ